MTYPYFRSRESRSAMISHRSVPVQSCWNGMGKPCPPLACKKNHPLHATPRGFPCAAYTLLVIFDSSPFYKASPLRFRGIADSLATHHLEGSECCLIDADNPQSARKGVWLNPRVRVGYDLQAYATVHTLEPWPSLYDRFIGIWENRVRRWVTTVWFKEAFVRYRVKLWTKEGSNRQEPGIHCLINEMQVLVHNGWAHV